MFSTYQYIMDYTYNNILKLMVKQDHNVDYTIIMRLNYNSKRHRQKFWQ